MQEYLPFLKAFVEGEINTHNWNAWWSNNAEAIEAEVSRLCYLRLKHQPFREACAVLDEYEIPYTLDKANWLQKQLEGLSHLWDRSQNWILSATHHDDAVLTVVFAGDHPTVQELIALRKLLVQYRDMPASQMKEKIGTAHELNLGTFSSIDTHETVEQAKKLGLNIIATDASYITYMPIQRINGVDSSIMLIEDEELAAHVIQKMLEAGIPVETHAYCD